MFFNLFSKYYDLSTEYWRLKNINIIYPKTENSQKSRHNGQKRAFRYFGIALIYCPYPKAVIGWSSRENSVGAARRSLRYSRF